MTLTKNVIFIVIAAIIFFVAFMMGYGVIIDKQPLEETVGLISLGLCVFAIGHLP